EIDERDVVIRRAHAPRDLRAGLVWIRDAWFVMDAAASLELSSRARAREDVALHAEPVERALVRVGPRALVDHRLVGLHAEPRERVENALRGAGHFARRVD